MTAGRPPDSPIATSPKFVIAGPALTSSRHVPRGNSADAGAAPSATVGVSVAADPSAAAPPGRAAAGESGVTVTAGSGSSPPQPTIHRSGTRASVGAACRGGWVMRGRGWQWLKTSGGL